MTAQTAFGAAFLAALILLAYCIFVLPPKHLDIAVNGSAAIRWEIRYTQHSDTRV